MNDKKFKELAKEYLEERLQLGSDYEMLVGWMIKKHGITVKEYTEITMWVDKQISEEWFK